MNGGSERHELRRVLTLRDLVLGQVLIVVGLNFTGTAARLGSAHRLLWVIGILLFHLPLAAVVIRLARERPMEGGIYHWARLGFGEAAGFLVGWNFWLFSITYTSTIGLATSQGISYALASLGHGPTQLPVPVLHLGLVALLTLIAVSGLGAGRWVSLAGALLLPVLLAALVTVAFTSPPVTAARPPSDSALLSLVLFTKMTVYALAGLECLATLAGEARRPERNLPLSVLLAAPLICTLYLAGTESILRLVPSGSVDLVNPVAQAFSAGAGAAWGAAAILALLLKDLAQSSLGFTAITRLPMVAGWDHLLPGWFAKLDDRRQLPTRSIVVAGAAAGALGVAGSLGVGVAEAYQVLQSAAGLFFAANYLVLFAIPLLGRPGFSRPPIWLRLAALSAFAVTAAFMVLSAVPVVEVGSSWAFAGKVMGVFVLAQLAGVALLRLGRKAAS